MFAPGPSTEPDPYRIPLERLDPSDPGLFQRDVVLPYFERLRREDPVHFTEKHIHGPYWSITRFDDIVTVNTDHETFSSRPAITIANADEDFPLPMFIASDAPKHAPQRKVVAPVASAANLDRLEPLVRERAAAILDGLPLGEDFDWVDRVAKELSSMTLATLLGVPQADRRKLIRWADVATADADMVIVATSAQRKAELEDCVEYFTELWRERAAAPPADDLISRLAHSEATRDMDKVELLGAVVLLLVAGSETTRSGISGSVLALYQFPDQFELLKAEPALIGDMISETMRWQSPAVHMRRIARRDVELGGKRIRRGDKVVMWYLSGNRDESVMERPNDFWIRRPNVRRHLSYGQGVHRCIGARLGEMQIQVLWQELLSRYSRIEVVGQPSRFASCFARSFHNLPVRLTAK